ncbi:MAG TPA: hypothetical protein VM327_09165 [Candidatus Thermoplasmatota archaeon]|nr:hypothetical protein [Candidatus Thermoplasmatota archaeon]
MALPKPLSEQSRNTGMPQMRRRSGLRTASANLQEAFLDRVRAVRDDPTVVLPEVVGDEPKEIAKLRHGLEQAKDGTLGFFAKRDKGILGAAWACRALAEKDAAPRLLDARIEGDKRFYWPVGHIAKPACLGVQNWDDPATLLMAYQPLADEGLHFFAGGDLWCTGRQAVLVPDWLAALAQRLDVALVADGADARCPHADRAALAHVLPASAGQRAPEIRLCPDCCGKDTAAVLGARMRNPGGRRPYTLEVVLPDGSRRPVEAEADAFYRVGRHSGGETIADALAGWHKGLAGRFAVGDRLFASQDEFLDAVEAPTWMRPALAAMTAGGHAGPATSLADLLVSHREHLPEGLRALGADPAQVVARGANADEGALLRIAHEDAERAAKTADLPAVLPAGPVGAWIDGFVRSRRIDGEVVALQKVRRQAPRLQHKAHVAAFIAACGGDPGMGFSFDTKEAGLSMAPLAKRVLDTTGPAYVTALREYLSQSGSGETLA